MKKAIILSSLILLFSIKTRAQGIEIFSRIPDLGSKTKNASEAEGFVKAFQIAHNKSHLFAVAFALPIGVFDKLAKKSDAIRIYHAKDDGKRFVIHPMYKSTRTTLTLLPREKIYSINTLCYELDCISPDKLPLSETGDPSTDITTARLHVDNYENEDHFSSFLVMRSEYNSVFTSAKNNVFVFHGLKEDQKTGEVLRVLVLVEKLSTNVLDWGNAQILDRSHLCPEECDFF